MDDRRDRQVTFLAEHRAIENVDETFGALGTDREQSLVYQEIGYSRNTALADMRFLGQYEATR